MPCHHNLEKYLGAYLEGTGIISKPKSWLFPTIKRGTGQLSEAQLPQASAYAMIQRRAKAVGIETKINNNSFRATGIAAYFKNGGTLKEIPSGTREAGPGTVQLYDWQREINLDLVGHVLP